MGFLSLFVVALVPILKVLLVTAVGSLIALERIDLLGPDARRFLNAIVFYVYNPALVSSNLAKTITLNSLLTMWFMPVNILLTFLTGSALGWILIKITRTPQHLQALVLGCCSAGNLGNLLFIIIPAICDEKDNPFGDSDCSTYGLAYASLSMAMGAIGIWSYVYNIMRISASKCKRETNIGDSISITAPGETLEILSEDCAEPLLPSEDSPSSRNCSDEFELTHSASAREQKVPFWEKIKQQVGIVMEKINLKKLFAPSTIGVIVGFFIGLIPPIRKLIIGDSAPLHVIESSAYFVGEAAIPSLTLIMGANLLKGLKGSDISIVVIVGIMAVRYIALPLLGVVVVKAAYHFGLLEGSNSLFRFVLMLQYALPPAMSTSTMSQLFEFGQAECAVVLLWSYAVATLTLTLWSSLFMWLVS